MEKFSGQDMRITAIIPARGGSKGVLRKNVALVAGRPLISWTIEEALKCDKIDKVVVNTDDLEIAEIAKAYGAETQMRPSELAQDSSSVFGALNYGLDRFKEQGHKSTHTLQLNPTSPLRTVTHINESIQLLEDFKADSVVSVTQAHTHPYWCKVVSDDFQLNDFLDQGPDDYKIRQELPEVYALNGSIFLVKNELIRANSYYGGKTVPYIMTSDCSIDIDTPWELYLANLVLTDRKNL